MNRHFYGYLPDEEDSRDFAFQSVRPPSAPLPPVVDLRHLCSPVRDQGQLGSCTGFAIAVGMREFLLRKLGVPGYDMAPHFAPDGVVSAPDGLGVVEEFKALKRLAPGRHLKVALPGPLTFAGFMEAGGRDTGAIIDELVGIVRAELAALVTSGADYIQLDEPGLPERLACRAREDFFSQRHTGKAYRISTPTSTSQSPTRIKRSKDM